jgi:hypothetical protein
VFDVPRVLQEGYYAFLQLHATTNIVTKRCSKLDGTDMEPASWDAGDAGRRRMLRSAIISLSPHLNPALSLDAQISPRS